MLTQDIRRSHHSILPLLRPLTAAAFGAALTLAILFTPPVAAEPVAVVAAGFDERGDGALPIGWQVRAIDPAGAADVARDPQVFHGGTASLRIANTRAATVTVVSEPVTLVVGRPYRLTAWMRTEGAYSDPLARYPTAVPACLDMESFPFTNHSPAVGATRDWTRIEMPFVATRSQDRVRLHLGWNGTAAGTAWFDDVTLQSIDDVADFVPLVTVRWADAGFRTERGGWILLHIEGEPYARGYQHGFLLADEIAAYIQKLATQASSKDPAYGWNNVRTLADATMLRGFSTELLTEMRGIADGAAKGGATYDGRPVEFLDVVALNSAIDVDYLKNGLNVLPHALTGKSFLTDEEELRIPDGQHKCSAIAATGPATADGRVVFGQLFMWSGYTGVHFNVLLDLVPAAGERLVYQTFPGGIHSGTDFYMNTAGIIAGETTVAQTPWNPDGTPMSDRIRRAMQYGRSIDEVVTVLAERNNGLYTNDWPLADIKTGETAICLLGTDHHKVWRTGDPEPPFGTPGFLWANNNARDEQVRSEYAAQPKGAPYDPVFSPWNRDLAFNAYYAREHGRIDVPSVARLFATSPINLSHACDGKITSSEMASELVFWAHQGKVTLREKFPAAGNRRMPDLPGARPHFTYGYTAVTPVWLATKLAEAKAAGRTPTAKPRTEPKLDLTAVQDRFVIAKKALWTGTLFPESAADHWLASGTAGYWQILNDLPDDEKKGDATGAKRAADEKTARVLGDALARQNVLLQATLAREDDLPASWAERSYTRYAPYRVARVKGTFALHQLRLHLGTDTFLAVMRAVHERFAGRPVTTADFESLAREVGGCDVRAILRPWRERTGFPAPEPEVAYAKRRHGWRVTVRVTQPADNVYPLATSVEIETDSTRARHPLLLAGESTTVTFEVPAKPLRVVFDPGSDIPVARDCWASWANLTERWPEACIVHGTSRTVEAQRTLALRFQTTLADAFTEQFVPIVKDCEITEEALLSRDLVLLGGPLDNTVVARAWAAFGDDAPAAIGDGYFRFRDTTDASPTHGLFLALPSPFARDRIVWLFAGNSVPVLYDMTKSNITGLPSWAVFHGEEAKEQGYLPVTRFGFEGPKD